MRGEVRKKGDTPAEFQQVQKQEYRRSKKAGNLVWLVQGGAGAEMRLEETNHG